MSDRTSPRGFFGTVAAAFASLTAPFGWAFGRERHAGLDDAPGPDALPHSPSTPSDPDGDADTTYTYDQHGRLVAVCEPHGATTTVFAFPDV